MSPDRRSRHDVVVVGARVAGSATAMLLAALGHDVVVVDRAELPSDTISTHQIARPGVLALRRWGLLDDVLASGAPALRQVSFHVDGGTTSRPISEKFGVDCLVAPRRYVLDAMLAERAVKAGTKLRTGVAVSGVLVDDDGRATGVRGHGRDGAPVEIESRFVVGADGLTSRVARCVGARVVDDRGGGGSTMYAYYSGPLWTGIEHYYGDRGLAGIFPTHDGQACIWVCAPEPDTRAARRSSDSAADAFAAELRRVAPALATRLQAAHRNSPVRGMLHAPNHLRRAHGPGWALVGDAGFHRDAVSAHGISDAFRDAEFLAAALDMALRGAEDETSALAGYQKRRDAGLRVIFDLTCALVRYPPVPEFVELMRRLGQAIDAEAASMAEQPVPGEHQLCPP
jgi:flavin-dependent dehydrogenase